MKLQFSSTPLQKGSTSVTKRFTDSPLGEVSSNKESDAVSTSETQNKKSAMKLSLSDNKELNLPKRIMIVTRSFGNCLDMKRYLAAIFISKERELKYLAAT